MGRKMLAVLSLASILAVGARAQQQGQTSPSHQNSGVIGEVQEITASTQETRAVPDDSTIRTNVSLVSSFLVARNVKGELVMDLDPKDLRIFDNGIQQTLEAFEMGGAPISLAIVVENSSRIRGLLPSLRRTGILFTQKVLGEDGEAAVIGYNDAVIRLLDFTSDDNAIEKTFTDIQSGTSGAHLYDAMSQAVRLLQDRPPARRRVIVTLAEARDTGSDVNLGQVLRQAQVADITIYSVGLSTVTAEIHGPQQQAAPPRATPPGTYGLPAIPGSVYTPTVEELRNGNIDLSGLARPVWAFSTRKPPLEAAVAATGGLYQSTAPGSSIEIAIDQIGGELNAQYMLSYRRAGSDAAGYHQIKVEVIGQRTLNVRSRPGYYLP